MSESINESLEAIESGDASAQDVIEDLGILNEEELSDSEDAFVQLIGAMAGSIAELQENVFSKPEIEVSLTKEAEAFIEDGKVESFLPEKQYDTDAGADIRACIPSELQIYGEEWATINTGIKLQIPDGYEVQVRPRSGLAYKNGISVLNTPGTIDSDYTGEIKVILVNHSFTDYIVSPGDRIAQLVVSRTEPVQFSAADTIEDTSRGDDGFGSTGVE